MLPANTFWHSALHMYIHTIYSRIMKNNTIDNKNRPPFFNHLICGVTLGGAMVCLDSLVWLFLKNIGITDRIWLRGPQHGRDRPALTQRGPDTGQHRADIKRSTNLSKGPNIRAHNPTLEAKWRWLGYPCSNQSRGQTWTQRGTNSTMTINIL